MELCYHQVALWLSRICQCFWDPSFLHCGTWLNHSWTFFPLNSCFSVHCLVEKFCNHLEKKILQGKAFVQGHNFLIQKLLVLLAMVLVSLVLTCCLMEGVSWRRVDWEMCLSDCDCWATAVMSFSVVGALPGFVSVASSVTCYVAVELEA